MYKLGDRLLVLSHNHGWGYEDRIGQIGEVVEIDGTSIKLVFKTEQDDLTFGWFLFKNVVYAADVSTDMTVEKAVDFLITKGYTVQLSD